MNEAQKNTMNVLRNNSIPCCYELSKVECTVTWLEVNGCHTPTFQLGGHALDTDISVETADHEDFEYYEQNYGSELEEGRYYYYDGELYHDEMSPYREHDEFSQFIASEVNARIWDLNNG
ncbi:hypothetical protein [Endozoicomonas sp. SESOKO4]|uniref:hypothetical protein n=1 Tax=Endozoicomonas sp. SESOKO4 TaxID=2828745 RepID=UPI002147CA09|nr:hypothetical protein [Endozoicomonas sp. SESOKO4]